MKNGREFYGGSRALSLVALLLRVRLSALIHKTTLFLESFRSRICSFPSARPTWSPSPRRKEPGCASTSLPELHPPSPALLASPAPRLLLPFGRRKCGFAIRGPLSRIISRDRRYLTKAGVGAHPLYAEEPRRGCGTASRPPDLH